MADPKKYAAGYEGVVRYNAHAAFHKAITDAWLDNIRRLTPKRNKYYYGEPRSLDDPTPIGVYADYLDEIGHPAAFVFRRHLDPEMAEIEKKLGYRGMFVGAANQPDSGDGLTWFIAHGKRTKMHPSHPFYVSVGYTGGDQYGSVHTPLTPDEADSLADRIDAYYEGKQPIAASLRETAARYRGGRRRG